MNSSKAASSNAMRTFPSTCRMSSEGQKKPSAPTKKWGDPITPRRRPSCQSSRTSSFASVESRPAGTPACSAMHASSSGREMSRPLSKRASLRSKLTRSPVRRSRAYATAARPSAGSEVDGSLPGSKCANRLGAMVSRSWSTSSAIRWGSSGALLTSSRGHAVDAQHEVQAVRLSALDELAQPHVGERAPHVREHLEGRHVKMICPPAAFS